MGSVVLQLFVGTDTVFCLASCPFLGSLVREQVCFVWSAFTGLSGLPASLTPSLGYLRQQENPGNTSPLVLRSLASLPSPLHLLESSYVFVVFSVCLFCFLLIHNVSIFSCT